MLPPLQAPPARPANVAATPPSHDAARLYIPSDDDEKWRRQTDQLLRVRRLRDNWDSEGAVAPDPATVDSALTLLEILRSRGCTPPSRLGPAGDGTIIIEWQRAEGHLSVEISIPYHGEWMLAPTRGSPSHWTNSWASEQRRKTGTGITWSAV